MRPRRGAPPPPRVRRLRHRGQSLVEFSLIAPLFLLLLLGLVILGVFVLNNVELTNGVRDGARAGAICGSELFDSGTSAKLPNGTVCSIDDLKAYVISRITTIPGVKPDVTVDVAGGLVAGGVACSPGQKIRVTAQYAQPLFVPFVGHWWGDAGDPSVRTVKADAEATCEQ